MRLPVFDRRRAGVLLPLSALEAPLGRGGRAFIDWLAEAGFSVWQILPVGPVGADGSPYWVRSDFAGNPAFIDLAELADGGASGLAEFVARSAAWLPDFALFEALTHAAGGAPFWLWPAELATRVTEALERARRDLAPELARIECEQYAFHRQWRSLREHARARGVRLFGDLPFYLAPSSVGTWAHREWFQLAPNGEPAAVAGVPPDYYSEKGQLWGNPLYDWPALQRADFSFWRERLRAQLARFDLLRLDHFRAFAAHWAVPASAADARSGAWVSTPGTELFRRLLDEFSDLPLVAEDLGLITDDVLALKNAFGLPGMRVLQFAFDGDAGNPHLPYWHERNSLVYTGTHDNDTTLGWYRSLDAATARRVDFYLGATVGKMPRALSRAALASVAKLAIFPAQDLLALGSEARLNTPATVAGNWSWRLPPGALTAQLAAHCAQLNRAFGRA